MARSELLSVRIVADLLKRGRYIFENSGTCGVLVGVAVAVGVAVVVAVAVLVGVSVESVDAMILCLGALWKDQIASPAVRQRMRLIVSAAPAGMGVSLVFSIAVRADWIG
jgi:hypothetical protein